MTASTGSFVVNSDGTKLTQLTDNNVEDEYPSISYAGERIVFGANNDIYLANYGSDGESDTLTPTSSPDPRQLEPTFPTEILVGVMIIIVIIVLVVFYLKRK